MPIVGGLGLSNGGYCHATFTIQNGAVTRLLYSGEKNATLAPNAYCAPIVRTCLTWLDAHPDALTTVAATADHVNTSSANPAVPPGASSGAPQPQSSIAGFQPNMPTPTPR